MERSVPADGNQATLLRRVIYKDNAGREEDVLDKRSDADMTLHCHASSASRPAPVEFCLDIEIGPDSMPATKRTDHGKQTAKIINDQYRAGLASLKWVLER